MAQTEDKWLDPEFDIDEVLAKLSMADKIDLLGGRDFWHTVDFPQYGIPPVRMSDGPNGLRGTRFFNGTPSNCFPCGTGAASSFDVDLLHAIGSQLAKEAQMKGAHVVLGPTVNIQRSPLGGRGFESFSEDPCLSGTLAGYYVKGLQDKGVAATIKHYAGNEQELNRFSSDSIIPERALREIYLEAFRVAQKIGSPFCYMTGYNRVNGVHCSENPFLIDQVLRKEWGFDGLVMSDWTGVYSTAESMRAGLDLEMPGPPVYRGATCIRSLQAGKIYPYEVDERVRNVLKLVKFALKSGIPFNLEETSDDSPEVRALLRKAAADAVVLLKNDKKILPITKDSQVKKIAVIGSNARVAIPSGGGSASMLCSFTTTPLEGITAAAKEIGAEVEYAIGTAAYEYLPAVPKLCSHPKGESEDGIAELEFYLGEPPQEWEGDAPSVKGGTEPVLTISTNTTIALMMDGIPPEVSQNTPYIRYTTLFSPDQPGDWEIALGGSSKCTLFFDGKLLIDNATTWKAGEMFFGFGSEERRGVAKGLETDKKYPVEIRFWPQPDTRAGPFKIAGAIRFGALPLIDSEKGISVAAEVARNADLAVCVVGLNEDFETEGYDRKHMDLPPGANELVAAVLEANPNTIVVNQTGTPVTMPWVDQASTIVQAWYAGNDLGNGLADVLFGKVNPAGKLPITFPKRLADSPSDIGFGVTTEHFDKTHYQESIYVGYRYFDKVQLPPLFPFGHGLSYTTFAYSNLSVSPISPEGTFDVSFEIENTGSVEGREAAQIYISDKQSRLARPPKELKGFKKVAIKPGKKEKVSISLDRDALKYWDDQRQYWIAEAGEFEVLVGGSSADTPLSETVELETTFTWTGL